MIWALIQNGLIVNTVLASPLDFKDPSFVWVDITNLSPSPGIGWAYDGTNFTDPNGV